MVAQQNTMVSGSGAVENNKHQTLSFPIYVGFKRTPYDIKSYSKPPPPPADRLRLCAFNNKCIKHRLWKIFNLVEGGLSNREQSKQTERLREAFTRVQGAGPLAGVARGQHPLT